MVSFTGYSTRLLVLPCCLLLVFCAAAGTTGLSRERETALPDIPESSHAVGSGAPRQVTVCHVLPSKSGAPIVVVIYDHEVWYIDSSTLEVISKNEYPVNERIVVAEGGEFIAIWWEIENRRTNKIRSKVRVEDWTGRRLWEKDIAIDSRFEPTPRGGLIVYPSAPSWLGLRHTSSKARTVPEIRPHGLLIYGEDGAFLVEGVAYEDIRMGGRGWTSPDGGYLAFTYQHVQADGRSALSPETDDVACLVLFDLNQGNELWRHQFSGIRARYSGISTDAHRVLSFASLPGQWPTTNFEMFLFDREGNVLAKKQFASISEDFSPQVPVLSPNGNFCAFTANKATAYLVDMRDGNVLWSTDSRRRSQRVTCLSVSDEGDVLLELHESDGSATSEESEIWILDIQGRVALESRDENVDPHERIHAGYFAANDSLFWLFHDGEIVKYGLEMNSSFNGSEDQ